MATPLSTGAFGDLRTIDSCGIVTPDAFAGLGSARPLSRSSLDECTFAVTVRGDNAEVRLGMLDRETALTDGPRAVRGLPGGARIVRQPSADGCELYLVLADGLTVSSFARAQTSNATFDEAQLCGVAEAGVTGAHRVATAGRVARWEPPANSLTRLSPCGLLPAGDIANRTGIDPEDVTLLPAEHQCRWGPAGEKPNVQLDFFVGKEIDDTSGVLPPPEDVAGRPTIVLLSQVDAVKVCNAYTDNIPYALGTEGEIERAAVRVVLPGTDARDACAIARDVAALAWPKLPAK